jgi:hypothetical protein
MAYGMKNKKSNNNYLKDIKGAMTPMIDGKKTAPKKKKNNGKAK